MLLLAASINAQSEHPLAEAIVNKAKKENLTLKSVSKFEAVSGKGVEGVVDNKSIIISNDKLLHDKNVTVAENQKEQIVAEQKKGKTKQGDTVGMRN